jgi:NTP pyrophosphatase (non-canonical NTP hydrolase)
MMTEHTSLREANAARQKEWDPGDYASNLDWRLNELGGELGELCNVLKKLHRERCGVRGSRATIEQLTEELADVVICIDLTAMERGWDPVVPYDLTSNEIRPLTEVGKLLLIKMGQAALFIADNRGAAALMDLFGLCVSIAKRENIDLTSAVAAKFNATSEKVGLETRLLS